MLAERVHGPSAWSSTASTKVGQAEDALEGAIVKLISTEGPTTAEDIVNGISDTYARFLRRLIPKLLEGSPRFQLVAGRWQLKQKGASKMGYGPSAPDANDARPKKVAGSTKKGSSSKTKKRKLRVRVFRDEKSQSVWTVAQKGIGGTGR